MKDCQCTLQWKNSIGAIAFFSLTERGIEVPKADTVEGVHSGSHALKRAVRIAACTWQAGTFIGCALGWCILLCRVSRHSLSPVKKLNRPTC